MSYGDALELKRDPANAMLIGPDGAHYANEHMVYHYAVLGLCGCGNPEEAYNFCREALSACDRRGGGEWTSAQDAVRDLILRDPDVAAHAILHLLDNLQLIEHGGSIGGSWLTPRGERIVDLRPVTQDDYDTPCAGGGSCGGR
jgi:hypothetical protein